MAETVSHNVVNGNQSMGANPAPIDAPEETQPSSRAVEGVGDVKIQQNILQENLMQDNAEATRLAHSSATQANVGQTGALAIPPTVSKMRLPLVTSLMSNLTSSQETVPTTNNGQHASEAGGLATMSNDSQSSSTFPEPFPTSLEATDLEWRRSPSQIQDPVTRSDRSNSIKKPTSFKSVSVTKNFLAKSTTGTATAHKAAPDKSEISPHLNPTFSSNSYAIASSPSPAPSTSSAGAKPRLVAKSVRDVRSAPLTGQAAPGGPDASKVWNRNRRMSFIDAVFTYLAQH